ncbi:MAG: hypothetical protein QOI61_1802 [Actinomycetota bacterium]
MARSHATIRRASTADIGRLSAVLGAAFADYPWTRWTVDATSHVERVCGLQRLALEHLGIRFGEVWVAEVEGTLASGTVWMDSATQIPTATFDAMGHRQTELEGDRHAASVAAETLAAGMRPDERHLTLATVGTLPAMQRRGLGRAVIAPGLARADEEGVLAYLETSSESNVAFYTSMGFTITGRRDLPDGGPTVWAMTRG